MAFRWFVQANEYETVKRFARTRGLNMSKILWSEFPQGVRGLHGLHVAGMRLHRDDGFVETPSSRETMAQLILIGWEPDTVRVS